MVCKSFVSSKFLEQICLNAQVSASFAPGIKILFQCTFASHPEIFEAGDHVINCVFFIINYRGGPPLVNHLSDISEGFPLHSRINIGNLEFRVRLVTSIALGFHPTFSLLDGFHCSRIKGRK